MTGLAYILAAAVAGAVAGLVALAFKLDGARKDQLSTQSAADTLRAQRDQLATNLAAREAELKLATDRLAAAESQRNAATQEAIKHETETLTSAPAATVGDAVSDELLSPLPGVESSPDPAPSGGGGGQAATVQPAAAPKPAADPSHVPGR